MTSSGDPRESAFGNPTESEQEAELSRIARELGAGADVPAQEKILDQVRENLRAGPGRIVREKPEPRADTFYSLADLSRMLQEYEAIKSLYEELSFTKEAGEQDEDGTLVNKERDLKSSIALSFNYRNVYLPWGRVKAMMEATLAEYEDIFRLCHIKY